jgi:transcriptional regulator with XRE-family HTH domain
VRKGRPVLGQRRRTPLAALLTRLRLERGLTQAQVAAALDVSERTAMSWEHGTAEPWSGQLPTLAALLGADPGDLIAALWPPTT